MVASWVINNSDGGLIDGEVNDGTLVLFMVPSIS